DQRGGYQGGGRARRQGIRAPRYHVQQRGNRGRGRADRESEFGRLGPHDRGAAARGVPRHEVFDPRDAQGGRRIDHLDGVGRGLARGRLPGAVQRRQGGDRQPDAGGGGGSRARQ